MARSILKLFGFVSAAGLVGLLSSLGGCDDSACSRIKTGITYQANSSYITHDRGKYVKIDRPTNVPVYCLDGENVSEEIYRRVMGF